MNKFTEQLQFVFENDKNIAQAAQMKAYVRGQFDYFGIKAPRRKELSKQIMTQYGIPESKDFENVMMELWDKPEREFQYVAIELSMKYKKDWNLSFEDLIEYMVVHKSWWDTVDLIAGTLVGGYFKKYPNRMECLFKKWSYSDNFWLVRVAILFQLKYKNDLRTDLLSDVINRHCNSDEFFIQKAIGWALRQYSKFNPQWVIEYVAANDLKPLSKREALRLLK